MTTAFQLNAFQNDAFQIDGGTNTQYLNITLDDISANVSQTLRHTQLVDITLDGISVNIAQSSSAVVEVVQPGGGKSKGGKKRTIIIEVDGKDYRMDEGYVNIFLSNLQQKVKEQLAEQAISRKKARFVRKAPVIVVKSAPVEYVARVQQEFDRTSEKIDALFNMALIRYAQELDDEDALLMLIG